MERLLTPKETADILRCSVSSLNKWRLKGRGPRFTYVNNLVRYRSAAIAEYIAASERRNTSQSKP
jgi:predicted site-specific integrase-resolvase